MKHITYILYILLFATITTSCEKEKNENTDTVQKTKIAENQLSNGNILTLWADQSNLTVGYTPIYFSLENTTGAIPDKEIQIKPVMDMTSMSHGSPSVQPTYNPLTKLYEGAVVFTMASSEMGSWKIATTVDEEQVDFDITVNAESTRNKTTTTFQDSEENRYRISLVQPTNPKMGLQDIVIFINKQPGMDNYPVEEGLTIEFTPTMPQMEGHSSPNNVNPVHVSKGKYKGKVNFSMSGDWLLTFTIKRGETVLADDVKLELLVK